MSRAPLSRFATVLLALLAVMVPVVIALQGWAVGTLLSIERRLTRLETLQGISPGSKAPAAPGETRAGLPPVDLVRRLEAARGRRRRARNPAGSAAARGAAGARARRRARRRPGRGYLRLPRDPRARQLALLRRLGVTLRNPRKVGKLGHIKPDEVMGTSMTREEFEHIDALLIDGYTVLLVPLGDQVVIAIVDLAKIAAMIGEFPHELRH